MPQIITKLPWHRAKGALQPKFGCRSLPIHHNNPAISTRALSSATSFTDNQGTSHSFADGLTSILAVFTAGLAAGIVSSSGVNSVKAEGHRRGPEDQGIRHPLDWKTRQTTSNRMKPPPHPCTHAGHFVPGCHELVIFSGSSNRELASDIAGNLGQSLGKMNCSRFADGEAFIQVGENVRGRDVYIVQSLQAPVNDNIIELLLMVSATRRASAKRVTAIIPYYAYKLHRRGLVMSKSMQSKFIMGVSADVAKMLEVVGVDRVIAVDLQRHGENGSSFFDTSIPVESLDSLNMGLDHFSKPGKLSGPVVVVSPNSEMVVKARKFQVALRKRLPNLEVGLAAAVQPVDVVNDDPERPHDLAEVVGNVTGADVVIIDDFIDTGGTLASLSRQLKEMGAKRICAYVSHAMMNNDAHELIENSPIEELVCTNTVVPRQNKPMSKLTRLSVAKQIALVVQADHYKEEDPDDDKDIIIDQSRVGPQYQQ